MTRWSYTPFSNHYTLDCIYVCTFKVINTTKGDNDQNVFIMQSSSSFIVFSPQNFNRKLYRNRHTCTTVNKVDATLEADVWCMLICIYTVHDYIHVISCLTFLMWLTCVSTTCCTMVEYTAREWQVTEREWVRTDITTATLTQGFTCNQTWKHK